MANSSARVALASGLLWLLATGAGAQFVESEADLLYRIDGAATGEQFGFVSGRVGDIDCDGVFSSAHGSPIPRLEWAGTTASGFLGGVGVGRGRTAELIHEWAGNANGFMIGRGATDIDGDGHEDMLLCGWTDSSGAPQAEKAFVFSGPDGSLIMTDRIAGNQIGFKGRCAPSRWYPE